MRAFHYYVSNLSGWPDAGVVIAGGRAGARAVLNLEALSGDEALRLLRRADSLLGRPFSLKIDSGRPEAAGLIAAAPAAVERIFLTAAPADALAALARQAGGRELWLEAGSEQDARTAVVLGFAGLLAKGHEAGGAVGEETAFVLVQRLVQNFSLPVVAAGGVGRHTGAALYAAGASGVWLDVQLALTPESSLPEPAKEAIAGARADETICLGRSAAGGFRIFRRPGMQAVARAEDEDRRILSGAGSAEELAAWRRELAARIDWDGPQPFWPLGQDACLAAGLTRDFGNVAGVVRGLSREIAEHVRFAKQAQPWQAGAPLAASHGTTYPLLQGPMTRVSDRAAFALEVAEAGGLPFLALALLRGPQVRETLVETRELLGDRPWGVGILGFVPPELRAEQLEVVREIRPPFALIAGGRPDQALELEREGIEAYLHVPSPSLLETFLDQGARRFVFEGRECGGHVGPRTSFVLWEQAVAVLLEAIEGGVKAEDLHVVFAGGIHDARSAAMVAALAAPLAARGVRLGLLMGTAYLFTREAVASGAIVEGFQQRALECKETVLLESGPGHATRCAPTEFAEAFRAEKSKLLASGAEIGAIRDSLEALNVGRLRIASKGVDRGPEAGPRLVPVDAARQSREGLYMIGQVAALRSAVLTMAELHEDVSAGSSQLLEALAEPGFAKPRAARPEPPCDVAIVGMSCLMPGARNRHELWDNIVNKRDAVTEISPERFDIDLFFDADKNARDKVYSRWGGFLHPVAFDPLRYGIPPASLKSIDPMQLLSLLIVDQAMQDAGYDKREFDRERTSVIFGMSGGLGDLGIKYAVRSMLPHYIDGVPEDVYAQLPEWTEDSFAGILMNVTSGRIANRFNFGGVNFTVDAACASSLASLYLAARELNHGGSDLVVVGGCDTVQSPFGYMCFGTSKALSARGKCRTFDASADGIAISEGVAALIVRRLEDAERDGDRIYAVVKGVQGSSDGKGRGLTAPLPSGQARVLRRAYAQAGFPASTVSLIEAHGTGTVAGDAVELESVSTVFREQRARPASCAVGSIKSMIGHTKSSAGSAGLMKVALALYHGVQPPTLNVETPNPRLLEEGSPFYLNLEPQPWISAGPKRAAVSSFGFGGTNFHAVLEEYAGEFRPVADRPSTCEWPAELFFWEADSREALAVRVEAFAASLDPGKPLAAAAAESWRGAGSGGSRAAVVARSLDELRAKAAELAAALRGGQTAPAGCFHAEGDAGKLAFLFSGQGSQRPFMLRELALRLPELREALGEADAILEGRFDKPLSALLYPPHPFTPEAASAQEEAVKDTSVAQPALGAVETGLLRALRRLGASPDMTAGHSYGEYAALHAAGVFDAATLFRLSAERGACIKESVGDNPGAMAALSTGAETALAIAAKVPDVVVANHNSPKQTVLAGPEAGIQTVLELCEAERIPARRIPVACAFHSPFMRKAAGRFAETLRQTQLRPPAVTAFSNASAQPHSDDPAALAAALAEHLTSPVRWTEQIEAMYAAGARVFLEIGPGSVLTRLAQQILAGREDATIVAVEQNPADPTVSFLHAMAALSVRGLLPRGRELFRARLVQQSETPSDRAWLVTGGGAFAPGEERKAPAPVHLTPPAPAVPFAPAPASPAPVPPAYTAPAPAVAAAAEDEVERVMLAHQQLMQQFLTTQAQLMSAYLGAPVMPARPVPAMVMASAPPQAVQPPAPAPVAAPPPPVEPGAPPVAPSVGVLERLRAIASDRTGYPPELLDVQAALEADLGVDSIKRVEIIGAFQKTCGDAEREKIAVSMDDITSAPTLADMAAVLEAICGGNPAPDPPPAASAPAEDALPRLIRIASDRTGYPPELLDVRAALEADLGVDSIKRVEIIGAFQKTCGDAEREKIAASMDRLTSAATLADMAAELRALVTPGPGAVPAPSEPQPAVLPSADVLPALIRIASDRTGYPTELLDPAAALEADLGVDSIKRVEIIGAFQRSLSEEQRQQMGACMDRLTSAASLIELAERIQETMAPQAAPSGADAAPPARMVWETEPRARRSAPRFRPGRVALIACESPRRAMEMAEILRAAGENPAVVAHGAAPPAEAHVYGADLTDPAEVADLVARIRSEQGPIGAVVHMLDLDLELDVAAEAAHSHGSLRKGVKSAYLLARATFDDLQAAGLEKGARFIALTRRGGRFGLAPGACRRSLAAASAVEAFLKSLAAEDPAFACRVIDIADDVSSRGIVDELCSDDLDLQTGLTGGARYAPVVRLDPGDAAGEPRLPANPVFLITGGARGVTSQIARLAARKPGARLVLVGSTAPGEEDSKTAGLDGAALKGAILEILKAEGRALRPVDIEARYRTITRSREIRASLSELRSLGAEVEYHALDVADAATFGRFLDETYAKLGRIDVVVHGAGVIEDKLVRDKTPESFDRVFDTKAVSSLTLAQKLRPESLQALVFMSSISAAFGNRGQADYAAANGVMNGLALELAERWQLPVTAINWGPWDQRGMVSEGVRRQFEERGVGLIPLEAGAAMALGEMARRGDPLVIVGDGPWVKDARRERSSTSGRGSA